MTHSHQLFIFRSGTTTPIKFPVMPEPYGPFATGDELYFANARFTILKVGHSYQGNETNLLWTIALLIAPAAQDDNPIPWPW